MTPEQRAKHLRAIDRIEAAPRPEKWYLTRKLLFELKPWLVENEAEHIQACKEIRAASGKYAASQTGIMRNSMKLYGPVYTTLTKLDPELKQEMGSYKNASAAKAGKQLWDAFPEYRIARNY